MGRRRLLSVVLGVLLVALCIPAFASAASYSWDQPGDFTTTGLNPDHDAYGGTPWSYQVGPACSVVLCSPTSHDPSGFTPFLNFASGMWGDGSGSRSIGPSGTSLQIAASSDRFTVLGWQNPLGHPAVVTVTGSLTAGTGACSWSLDQDAASVSGASGTGTGSFTKTLNVPAAGSIYLDTYSTTLLGGDCVIAATLHLSESESTPVTLTSPANGSSTSSSQPTFAGTGTTAYGSSSSVAVKIYSGAPAAGSPVQILSAARRSDGSFSVAPSAPLSAGTYTAQALQSIPGDSGLSSPVTFTVAGSSSPVTLNLPGSGPLTSSTPTLTGQSGGDANAVGIAVFAGGDAQGNPVRRLIANRNVTTGTFSAAITPAVADGEYTAIAVQGGSDPGRSAPVTFRIKAHPPALTITVPTRGGHAFGPQPTISGTAGQALGDASVIALVLHQGSSAGGTTVGTATAPVSGGAWSLKWAKKLANGFYTLVATQTDDAGHTTTQTTSFVVVPAPPVIGSRVALRGTTASVAVACIAPSGTCAGNVLAVTTKRLRTRAGSPVGYVRVLYAYAKIPAGNTVTVRTRLPNYVAAALRKVHKLQVKVTVAMIGNGRTSATRSVTG